MLIQLRGKVSTARAACSRWPRCGHCAHSRASPFRCRNSLRSPPERPLPSRLLRCGSARRPASRFRRYRCLPCCRSWRCGFKKRRHKRFGIQLPEALELITRSLKAGHPVPVAISMVAREMPDPIGTEFGVVADEVTYGSDLVTALHAMFERVGHEDLPRSSPRCRSRAPPAAICARSSTARAGHPRARQAAPQGPCDLDRGPPVRHILTAVPALLFAGIMVLMPQFYTDVWASR